VVDSPFVAHLHVTNGPPRRLPTQVQIGIDFGGTKIEAAALDAKGEFLARIRSPNPGTYDAAIQAICDLVARTEHQVGTRGTVGIGTPGSTSPRTGLMRTATSVWLNGRRFREDVARALGRDVRLANDANCLALSEAVDGAAAGSSVTFAVVLGTGCGGGLVVNQQLVEGANGIGGEWGHIPLPWATYEELDAPKCWCGQRGCLETWVSGSGLQRDFAKQTGRALHGEDIVRASRSGDSAAQAALSRYVSRLGRALAVISNVVDPDTIVLGGGLSNVREIYEPLPQIVAAHAFCDHWRARIVPAKWGDSSGVRGAARLWQGA
jgi:fructokinase